MSGTNGLPNGWCWTTLEAITHNHDGQRVPIKSEDRDKRSGRFPYYGASGIIDDIDDYLFNGEYLLIAEDGANLLSRSTPIAFRASGQFWVNNHAHVVRTKANIPLAYLEYLLNSTNLRFYVTGTAQPKLNQLNMNRIAVPLAPLNEQVRIVAKIEELFSDLDAGVAALQRVRANLKRYRASVLKAAVEGKLTEPWRAEQRDLEPASELLRRTTPPARPNRWATRSKDIIPGHAALSVGPTNALLPSGWAWSAIVNVARMETGHTPSRQHPEWWNGDVPWVGIADAREHHGREILETYQHTNPDGLANSAARLLPASTVCISRTASVGYVVVMGRPMATSQDFVNWIPTSAVTSGWLRIVFLADRQALIRFGKGSVHKTIYFPEWLSVHVAVPPLAEQMQIVSEVEERLSILTATEAAIEASLKRAARLRQSILKRAFAGQLVVQDPNDEPAEKLLERIAIANEMDEKRSRQK